jgi:hypothetical protein
MWNTNLTQGIMLLGEKAQAPPDTILVLRININPSILSFSEQASALSYGLFFRQTRFGEDHNKS